MMSDLARPLEDISFYEMLGTIRSTDPRFGWIAHEFGEEPDRRLDLATMIEVQFADEPSGEFQRAELLAHLKGMIEDMRTLNPVEELFDIVAPCVPDPHRLSVLLRRMGWSGEFWYTEQEAAYALNSSVNQVRNERAKLVRALRQGPVWAPVLHRCAALVQELVPLTQTQFKVACGIELEGRWSMNLWGFLSALDLFGIDHWFHLGNVRAEPILYCDLPVDFGYQREYLDEVANKAERRISREITRQRRLRREEHMDRERYQDPWEVRLPRRSRLTDVGVGESASIYWWEIPRDSELRAEPGYDASNFGGPLVTSRTLIVHKSEHEQEVDRESEQWVGRAEQMIDQELEEEFQQSEEVHQDVESDLVDLVTLSSKTLVCHSTGTIDEKTLIQIELLSQYWTPIVERASTKCVGVVRTTRLRNKLTSGIPEIHANDPKFYGIEISRFTSLSKLDEALSREPLVFFNDDTGVWGVVLRSDS